MDTLTKILSLISVALILHYYYNKWVKYNEELQKKHGHLDTQIVLIIGN